MAKKDSKASKFLATATAPSATDNERKQALKHLGAAKNAPAVREEEADDVWTPQGILIRTRKEVNAYLRGPALWHLLKHVDDGKAFTARSIPQVDPAPGVIAFGQGDFYVILSWLLKHELAIRDGTKRYIPSKAKVRAAWNAQVDKMKL